MKRMCWIGLACALALQGCAHLTPADRSKAAERAQLSVIDDPFGAPTSAELLADVTAHMRRTAPAAPGVAGLYHCVAGGEPRWIRSAGDGRGRAGAWGWGGLPGRHSC